MPSFVHNSIDHNILINLLSQVKMCVFCYFPQHKNYGSGLFLEQARPRLGLVGQTYSFLVNKVYYAL